MGDLARSQVGGLTKLQHEKVKTFIRDATASGVSIELNVLSVVKEWNLR